MVFIHDHTFIKFKNNYYTVGTLDNALFQEYIDIFGEVTVIANYRIVENLSGQEIKVDNVHFELLPKSLNPFKFLKNIVDAILILKNIKEPIILRLPSFLGALCGIYLLLKKRKYMVEIVNSAIDSLSVHGRMGKALAPIMHKVDQKVILYASHSCYVTQNYLQNQYPTLGKSIGCSDVHITEIVKPQLKQFSADKIIIGTASAIDIPYKGHQYIIEAIAELKKQGIFCVYRIAGAGDKSRLAEIAKSCGIENQVEFTGYLDKEHIFEFYDTLDVYAQPSLTEGMPRAVLEAMSRGCVVIGTSIGEMATLIHPQCCFGKKDVRQIVKILSGFDVEKMKSLSFFSIKKIETFTYDVLRDKRDNFYKGFLKCFYEENSK